MLCGQVPGPRPATWDGCGWRGWRDGSQEYTCRCAWYVQLTESYGTDWLLASLDETASEINLKERRKECLKWKISLKQTTYKYTHTFRDNIPGNSVSNGCEYPVKLTQWSASVIDTTRDSASGGVCKGWGCVKCEGVWGVRCNDMQSVYSQRRERE